MVLVSQEIAGWSLSKTNLEDEQGSSSLKLPTPAKFLLAKCPMSTNPWTLDFPAIDIL